MTKFARLGWIAGILVAVIGLWYLDRKIDERRLGINTPDDKEKLVAFQQAIKKISDDTDDQLHKAIPEGATRIPDSEGEAKERSSKLTHTTDKFTTADGYCKIAFRLHRLSDSWRDVIGAQIHGRPVSADRIGKSLDVMTDCPKKKEELRLTLKGPKDLQFVYVVVGE